MQLLKKILGKEVFSLIGLIFLVLMICTSDNSKEFLHIAENITESETIESVFGNPDIAATSYDQSIVFNNPIYTWSGEEQNWNPSDPVLSRAYDRDCSTKADGYIYDYLSPFWSEHYHLTQLMSFNADFGGSYTFTGSDYYFAYVLMKDTVFTNTFPSTESYTVTVKLGVNYFGDAVEYSKTYSSTTQSAEISEMSADHTYCIDSKVVDYGDTVGIWMFSRSDYGSSNLVYPNLGSPRVYVSVDVVSGTKAKQSAQCHLELYDIALVIDDVDSKNVQAPSDSSIETHTESGSYVFTVREDMYNTNFQYMLTGYMVITDPFDGTAKYTYKDEDYSTKTETYSDTDHDGYIKFLVHQPGTITYSHTWSEGWTGSGTIRMDLRKDGYTGSNIGSDSVDVSVYNADPSLAISHDEITEYRGTHSIMCTPTDLSVDTDESWSLYVDDGSSAYHTGTWSSGSSITTGIDTTDFAPGSHTFKMVVKDGYGGSTTKEEEFTISNDAPVNSQPTFYHSNILIGNTYTETITVDDDSYRSGHTSVRVFWSEASVSSYSDLIVQTYTELTVSGSSWTDGTSFSFNYLTNAELGKDYYYFLINDGYKSTFYKTYVSLINHDAVMSFSEFPQDVVWGTDFSCILDVADDSINLYEASLMWEIAAGMNPQETDFSLLGGPFAILNDEIVNDVYSKTLTFATNEYAGGYYTLRFGFYDGVTTYIATQGFSITNGGDPIITSVLGFELPISIYYGDNPEGTDDFGFHVDDDTMYSPTYSLSYLCWGDVEFTPFNSHLNQPLILSAAGNIYFDYSEFNSLVDLTKIRLVVNDGLGGSSYFTNEISVIDSDSSVSHSIPVTMDWNGDIQDFIITITDTTREPANSPWITIDQLLPGEVIATQIVSQAFDLDEKTFTISIPRDTLGSCEYTITINDGIGSEQIVQIDTEIINSDAPDISFTQTLPTSIEFNTQLNLEFSFSDSVIDALASTYSIEYSFDGFAYSYFVQDEVCAPEMFYEIDISSLTAIQTGTLFVILTVNDGLGKSGTKTPQLSITNVNAPNVAVIGDTSIEYGNLQNDLTITITDPTTKNPTYSLKRIQGVIETDLIFEASWESGTPISLDVLAEIKTDIGDYIFKIIAKDGLGKQTIFLYDVSVVHLDMPEIEFISPNQPFIDRTVQWGEDRTYIFSVGTDISVATPTFSVKSNDGENSLTLISGNWVSGNDYSFTLTEIVNTLGIYDITITVDDGIAGGIQSHTFTITVENSAKPTISFIDIPSEINYDEYKEFSFSISGDPTTFNPTYQVFYQKWLGSGWSVNNPIQLGSWINGYTYSFNSSLFQDQIGDYMISVIAFDGISESDTNSFMISVINPDTPLLTWNQQIASRLEYSFVGIAQFTISDSFYLELSYRITFRKGLATETLLVPRTVVSNGDVIEFNTSLMTDLDTYTYYIYLDDGLDGLNTYSDTFQVVNDYAPEIAINPYPATELNVFEDIILQFTISDPSIATGSYYSIEYSYDLGQRFEFITTTFSNTGTFTHDLTSLSSTIGLLTVYIEVFDNVPGNDKSDIAQFSIDIDNHDNPTIQILSLFNHNIEWGDKIDWNINISDTATFNPYYELGYSYNSEEYGVFSTSSWLSGINFTENLTFLSDIGEYYVKLIAFDGLGKTATFETIIRVLNSETPFLEVSAIYNKEWGESQSVSFTISDPTNTEDINSNYTAEIEGESQIWTLSENVWSSSEIMLSLDVVQYIVGDYIFRLIARDGIGGITIHEDHFSILNSDTPTISISPVPLTIEYMENHVIDWNATDSTIKIGTYQINITRDNVQIWEESGSWVNQEGSSISSNIFNDDIGQIKISITVSDGIAGGISTATRTLSVINTDTPQIMIDTIPDNIEYMENHVIDWNATDSTVRSGAYNLHILKGAATVYDQSFGWVSGNNYAFDLSEIYDVLGTYVIHLTVFDGLGGSSAESSTINVLNSDAPQIFAEALPEEIQYGDSGTFSYYATDPTKNTQTVLISDEYNGDSITLISTNWVNLQNIEFDLSEINQNLGVHYISVTFHDGLGKSNSTTQIVSVLNSDAPTVNVDTILSLQYAEKGSINFTLSDPTINSSAYYLVQTSELILDSGTWISGNLFSVSLDPLSLLGSYLVSITVFDGISQVSTQTFTFSRLNSEEPQVMLEYDSEIEYGDSFCIKVNISDSTINGSATVLVKYTHESSEFILDSSTWLDDYYQEFSPIISNDLGEYNFIVEAFDGISKTTTEFPVVFVQNTATPTFSEINLPENIEYDESCIGSMRISDPTVNNADYIITAKRDGYEKITISSNSWVSSEIISFNFDSIRHTLGIYVLTVVADDGLGKKTEFNRTISILNSDAPNITISPIPDIQWGDSGTFSYLIADPSINIDTLGSLSVYVLHPDGTFGTTSKTWSDGATYNLYYEDFTDQLGSHLIRLTATDGLGKQTIKEFSFYVNNSDAPIITFSAPSSLEYGDSEYLVFSATDPTAYLQYFELYANETLIYSDNWLESINYYYDLSELTTGIHNYSLVLNVFDGLGHISNIEHPFRVLNTDHPVIDVSSTPVNINYGDLIEISWSVEDPTFNSPSYFIEISHEGDMIWSETGIWIDGFTDSISSSLFNTVLGNIDIFIAFDDGLGGYANTTIQISVENTVPVLKIDNYSTTIGYGENISLSWNITDITTEDTNYLIRISTQGDMIWSETGIWIDGFTDSISSSLFNTVLGDIDIFIAFDDGLGGYANTTIQISVENYAPQFMSIPDDVSYEYSFGGMSAMSWVIEDSTYEVLRYSIFINNSLIETGTLKEHETISFDVSELDCAGLLSTHVIKCEVNDTVSNGSLFAEDIAIVSVFNELPEISSDLSNNNLHWMLSDDSYKSKIYSIYVDGKLNQTGEWDSGINLDLNLFADGSYAVQLIYSDGIATEQSDIKYINKEQGIASILPFYNEAPILSHLNDEICFTDETQLFEWTAIDSSIDADAKWEIYIDQKLVYTATFSDRGYNLDYSFEFSKGSHSISAMFYDGLGLIGVDFVNIFANEKPIIEDYGIVYIQKEDFTQFTWQINDNTTSNSYYSLYVNNELIKTEFTSETEIQLGIELCEERNYVVIDYFDGFGGSSTETTIIYVDKEYLIDRPDIQIVDLSSESVLTWEILDTSPISPDAFYQIMIDDELVFEDEFTQEILTASEISHDLSISLGFHTICLYVDTGSNRQIIDIAKLYGNTHAEFISEPNEVIYAKDNETVELSWLFTDYTRMNAVFILSGDNLNHEYNITSDSTEIVVKLNLTAGYYELYVSYLDGFGYSYSDIIHLQIEDTSDTSSPTTPPHEEPPSDEETENNKVGLISLGVSSAVLLAAAFFIYRKD